MTTPNMPGNARLPVPGNAEFLFLVCALIVAMIIIWISDSLTNVSWFDYFKWVSVAYLLSRGVAKASRVLEQ